MSCLSITSSQDCQPPRNNSPTCRSLQQLHKHFCPSNTRPRTCVSGVGNREFSGMESLPDSHTVQREWLTTPYLVFSSLPVVFSENWKLNFLSFYSPIPHPTPDVLVFPSLPVSLPLTLTHFKSPPCSNTVKETCVSIKVSDSCQHQPGFRSAVRLAMYHSLEVPHTSVLQTQQAKPHEL